MIVLFFIYLLKFKKKFGFFSLIYFICFKDLKKEFYIWKVDVVFNDGVFNVGKNWLYDVF